MFCFSKTIVKTIVVSKRTHDFINFSLLVFSPEVSLYFSSSSTFAFLYEMVLISPWPDQEGKKLQRPNSGFIQCTPHEAQYTS